MSRKPKLRNSHKTTDFDDKFEAFLKESMSSDDSSLDTSRVAKYLEVQKKKEQPWWMNEVEEDEDEDDDHGLTMTGKNFLKSRKERVGNVTKPQLERVPACDVRMSRDSLDGESLHEGITQKNDKPAGAFVPALSLDSSQTFTDTLTADRPPEGKRRMGFETMAEQKEKENFFQALEHESVKTVDYARLNQELDLSTTAAVGEENTTPQNKMAAADHADRGQGQGQHQQTDNQHDKQQKSSMLSKVSLLDSLDSTLGTKPAASREAKDDMQAIPEGAGEQEGAEEGGDGQMRGGTLTDDTDANRGTETNRGVTLKTATGCNTDTSREIEALHEALRQVGDGTLGSISKDFTFKDSSSKMFHETGGGTDGTHSTAAFAMKPVAPPRGGRHDRTVDDVIMEVQQAKRLPELGQVSDMATIAMTTNSVLGKIEEENGGATPKKTLGSHTQYNGALGLEMSPICNGKDSLDFSLLEKYGDTEGFEFDTSTPDRTADSRGRPTPKRSGSTSHTPDKKVQRYAHIKSSGYGVNSPAKSNQARVTWSMTEAAKQKSKGGIPEKSRSRSAHSPSWRSPGKGRTGNSEIGSLGSVGDSQLLHSLTQMLQEHLSSSGTNEDNVIGSIKELSVERVKALMDEITKWQHQYHEQQKTTHELQANMEAMERDFECRNESMRTEYEQEISRLKQQNYVLTAKVEQLQKQVSRRALVSDGAAEAGDESSRIAGMEKELEEQEKLISGFQTENERLYAELKKSRSSSKEAEAHMFQDNQKLRVDIAMLREELQRKDGQLRNKGLITGSEVQGKIAAGVMAAEGTAVLGANRIAHLEVELKQAKLREETYKKQQQTAADTKRQLELQVDELLRRVRDYEERTSHFATSQTFEAKEVEMSYKKEIERLNRKIQWYVENQQLLDKDVDVLKEKDNEIRRLKVKMDNLQSERGRKEAEVKAQTKQRLTEARRIQDLERQVKEMESIVRKRHPNSLPVLMWAAAAAEAEGEAKKPPSVKFLEKQMMKLEDELEVKDGEAERSIRVLEQKYNLMKLQYEDRIRELESQLAKCQHPEEGERPHTHSSALQRELDSVRERHKRKVGEQEQELERLRKEVMVLKHRETASARAETKSSKEADVELQLKVKLLQQDLANQEREKQLLQRSVQRLMKEKEQLLTECKSAARPASGKDRQKGKPSRVGKKRGAGTREVESEPEPLPAYLDAVARDKVYLPDTFAGQHVSEILQENEEVKFKVDRLQLEVEHQRVYHQKLLAENEARERRIREEADERVNALKSTHQMELHRVLTEHVMHNSASKVAELHNKLDAQEVVVRHLREQLGSAEVDREKLSVLRVRELALETQISKLQDELHEAKKCHSPEMRHLDALRTKISEMEARHSQRERELQQLLTQTHMNADADIRHEVDKWRHIVEEKNRETETFRRELDTILDVLRELQRQGVVLPVRSLPGR